MRLRESAGIAGRQSRAPHRSHLPMTSNDDAGLGPKCLNLDQNARLLREGQSRLGALRRQRSHVRIVSGAPQNQLLSVSVLKRVEVKLTTNSPKIIQRWRRICGDRGSFSYELLADFLWSFDTRDRLVSTFAVAGLVLVWSQNIRLGREVGSKRGHATTDTDTR
jgi:hypothetical protein